MLFPRFADEHRSGRMFRLRIPTFFFLAALLAGCGFMRDEPSSLEEAADVWRGDVAWIEVEFTLEESNDDFTGEGVITKSPIDGTWIAEDLTVEVGMVDLATMTGSWTADWGSGHATGEMDYPTMNLALYRTGETDVTARLRGGVQEDFVTWLGSFERDGRSTFLRMEHPGKLPLVEIDVTGTTQNDRIVLQLGPPYEFSGTIMGNTLPGVIVATSIGHYPITLRKVSAGARSLAQRP